MKYKHLVVLSILLGVALLLEIILVFISILQNSFVILNIGTSIIIVISIVSAAILSLIAGIDKYLKISEMAEREEQEEVKKDLLEKSSFLKDLLFAIVVFAAFFCWFCIGLSSALDEGVISYFAFDTLITVPLIGMIGAILVLVIIIGVRIWKKQRKKHRLKIETNKIKADKEREREIHYEEKADT